MLDPLQLAYRSGGTSALGVFGVKEAGFGQMIGRGMQLGSRVMGAIPVAGQAMGAVTGGLGSAISSISNGENWKQTAARTAAGAASGAMPLGLGLAAGAAADAGMNKLFAPPTGPAVSPMPGLINQDRMRPGHLPGMAS